MKAKNKTATITIAMAVGGAKASESGIEGVAVAKVGEMRGWGIWADGDFLDQIVTAGNATKKGVKVRLGHVNSADGPTLFLGWCRKFRRTGDSVFADVVFADAARKSPHGDLAGYVAALAAEAPETFGMSIIAALDIGEMERFEVDHISKDGRFVSPDKNNESNYEHARLAKLVAVDVVNDPGLTESLAAARRDAARGAEEEEEEMADKKEVKLSAEEFAKADPAAVERWREEGVKAERDRLSALQAAFADDPGFVLAKFAEGKKVQEAESEYWKRKAEAVAAEKEKLVAELELARKNVQAPKVEGEPAAAGTQPPPDGAGTATDKLMALAEGKVKEAKAVGKVLTFGEALRVVADENPELAAAYNG